MASTPEHLVTRWLNDAHSLEEQALVQMRRAPDIAGTPELANAFRAHLAETEEHERLVDERLRALGGSPSPLKEAVMRGGGLGFAMFAQMQPDTPGKLCAHGFSYEHLELASYLLLEQAADQASDGETAALARRIAGQERTMAQRLESLFDQVVDASLIEDLHQALTHYLTDAHALEAQSATLLSGASERAGGENLAQVYSQHLAETRRHGELLEQALENLGESPSALKDAAMRMGALNWSAFFQLQPDTPAKLAAFAYAFEHLEIAGYEMLARVADRRADQQALDAARRILGEERLAAQRIAAVLPHALHATLASA
jgi:ferritin-like metal-binding protein YciE